MPQEEKVCSKCGGAGRILTKPGVEGETDTWVRCHCGFAKMFKLKVGTEIASAPGIPSSPLYVPPEPGEPPEVDETKSNLFIKGWWADLCSHFKYVLTWKLYSTDLNYRIHIVTDEQLRTVYLGKQSYDKQNKKKREEIPVYNSLSDLIGTDFDLVIIKLGFLGHKNVAMPGILKEALLIRQAASLPTWIVESPEPDMLWGPGLFAYSEDTADYISARFKTINLTKKKSYVPPPKSSHEPGLAVDEEEEDTPSTPPPPRKSRMEAPVHDAVLNEVSEPSRYKSKKGKKDTRDDIV